MRLPFPAQVAAALLAGLALGALRWTPPGWPPDVVLVVLIGSAGFSVGYTWGREGLPPAGRALEGAMLGVGQMILGAGLMALLALVAGLPVGAAAASGAANGWYSLAGPVVAEVDPVLGLGAFLGNMGRELLHIIAYPLLATRGLACPAVALGGATAMDTGLPVVARYGGRDPAAVALAQGATITLLAPLAIGLLPG